MIPPITILLLSIVSSTGLAVGFDPFENSFMEIMTPITEESLQILDEYSAYRDQYPNAFNEQLYREVDLTIDSDDEKIPDTIDIVFPVSDVVDTEQSIISAPLADTITFTCVGTAIITMNASNMTILCK